MADIVSHLRRTIRQRRIETEADTEESARAFLAIRKALGYLALWLPAVLLVVALVGRDFRPSMSAFYYNGGRTPLVGTLFAIGVFFLAYTGHRKEPGEAFAPDFWVSKLAGVAVLIVAFVPTQAPSPDLAPWPYTASNGGLLQAVHTGSAVVFFGCLAFFSIVLFRRGDESAPGKRARNRIYLACGWLIVLAILAIAVLGWATHGAPDQVGSRLHPTFWLETVAVLAFAVSWLTKGKSVLVVLLERVSG
ncbi:MAG: hypothetical protein QOE90_877 [Thermoplasmata archaeon]|jgi:hypothetical protein|nr:hypothetical protein [Thermoplasmata archaeon]